MSIIISPAEFLITTLLSFALGMVFCLIYKVFLILPRHIGNKNAKKIIFVAADVTVFTVFGIIFSIFLYWSNDGIPRFTIVLFLLTGFFAQYAIISKIKKAIKKR